MESSGFVYSDSLTQEMRRKAKEDSFNIDLIRDMITKNRTFYATAQHLWTTLQVRSCYTMIALSLNTHANLILNDHHILGLYQPFRVVIARASTSLR